MENVVNIGLFIEHITYFIKMGIYVNKGTDKNNTLENCIKLYNKLKIIESEKNQASQEDETFVRRCLKRLNLSLKIDTNGCPINIRDKTNQARMIHIEGHESLDSDNIISMVEYATKNKIDILTGIPLIFLLRESKYQELLWQYTRSLFYISQLLISGVDPNSTSVNVSIERQKIFDFSINKLAEILIKISDLEEKIQINQVMTLDKFLNSTLVKTGITESNVNDARSEVKEIFQKKGLGGDNSMTKMIDSISDQLKNLDMSGGNIIQSMFGIAQNVANEMKGDLEKNPENLQNTLSAITEVFQDAMNDNSHGGDAMPTELKSVFQTILSIPSMANNNGEHSEEEINANLEKIIQENGFNRDDFFNMIKDDSGEINVNKLENLLTNGKN